MKLDFQHTPPAGGYCWWYLDAFSDDGLDGLTVIAFIGSVFSPYYALARRRGHASPENHCALNVALYGAQASRWSMTERGRSALRRDSSVMQIGPSRLTLGAHGLVIDVNEWSVPLPRRIRGQIRVRPHTTFEGDFALDSAGRHLWAPRAPRAEVEVDLDTPRVQWRGEAYLDTNRGSEPLESAFADWDWARATLPDSRTAVHYHVRCRDGSARGLNLSFGDDGARALPPLARHALTRSRWGIARPASSDLDAAPHIVKTLEDTPFYARTRLHARWGGANVDAMHESLSLARFASPWVQAMLPFRMPRRA
jgi:carotenoid 1,2-hydratase